MFIMCVRSIDSVCIGWFVIWFTSVRESCLFTLCFTVLGYSCQTFKVLLLLWRQLQEVCNTAYMNTLFYVYPHRAVFWWRGQRGKSILVGGLTHFRSVCYVSSGRLYKDSHWTPDSWKVIVPCEAKHWGSSDITTISASTGYTKKNLHSVLLHQLYGPFKAYGTVMGSVLMYLQQQLSWRCVFSPWAACANTLCQWMCVVCVCANVCTI